MLYLYMKNIDIKKFTHVFSPDDHDYHYWVTIKKWVYAILSSNHSFDKVTINVTQWPWYDYELSKGSKKNGYLIRVESESCLEQSWSHWYIKLETIQKLCKALNKFNGHNHTSDNEYTRFSNAKSSKPFRKNKR